MRGGRHLGIVRSRSGVEAAALFITKGMSSTGPKAFVLQVPLALVFWRSGRRLRALASLAIAHPSCGRHLAAVSIPRESEDEDDAILGPTRLRP